jgi:SAM-dependent methyltransferase
VPLANYAHRIARASRRRANGISYRRSPSLRRPISQACTYAQLQSAEFRHWCERLQLPVLTHRKTWEYCYILQALRVAGMAAPGRRGVGFGVGNEPITAALAGHGATILATDLPANATAARDWSATGQHAAQFDDLNAAGLCADDKFRARVSFAALDMNAIPEDLCDFDFAWSSCAMEHLGDLDAGLAFFERQLQCLKPGGIGVHTTEFNVSSDDDTIAAGHTVLYRRRDLEALVTRVRAAGHDMRITFAMGDAPEDLHVDVEPYSSVHLRTRTDGMAHTSFGLLVRRARRTSS